MRKILLGEIKALPRVVAFGTIILLSGCAHEPLGIPAPLNVEKVQSPDESMTLSQAQDGSRREKLTATQGPQVPLGRTGAEPISSSTPPHLKGEPISINFEGVRLPAFVNTVFGELLKVTFEIDNSVMQRDQMVTLRTAESMSPDDFFELVTEVLSNYGISVAYSNDVYRIVEAASVKKPIPRIIRARSASTVPSDLRPLFYFLPLDHIQANTMLTWINLIMADRVQLIPLPAASGLVLLGSDEDVRAATEIIDALDQPFMAGSRSLKIAPAFWSSQSLSQKLVEILTAEGYSIGIGGATNFAIKLVPVDALNIIIAFGSSADAMQHVVQWATDLDQPGQTVSSQGAYYYQIFNGKAQDIADVIDGMVGQGGAAAASEQGGGALSKQRIMVDEQRNAIIFVGTAEEYAQFRTLVQQMDRAPLEVLIEATIAEVTLNKGESLGIALDFDDSRLPAGNSTIVQSSDAGLFFSLVRDRASIISRLNAHADKNRVQILSSPRIVTSSGKPAAISVGTQVPIITSQETASGQVSGNTSILQSIQYRNTGVILNIQPTINSNRRVELQVSQEVSDAQANDLSGVQSPVILNRSIQTTLSLTDGETVLLGGMISENYSRGDSGVPYLKDIPLLGNLFKTESSSVDRTELIVLITPYIIDGPDTARQVREAFQSKLGDWARPDASFEPAKAAIPNGPSQK